MHFVLLHLCWSCLQKRLNLAPLCSYCEWSSMRQQNQNWMWPFQWCEHEGCSWNRKVSPPGKDELSLKNKLKMFLPILRVFYIPRSYPEEKKSKIIINIKITFVKCRSLAPFVSENDPDKHLHSSSSLVALLLSRLQQLFFTPCFNNQGNLNS